MTAAAMNAFRNVLDRLDGADPSHQLLFFRVLQAAGADAFQELSERARKASAGRAFCALVYEASFYYPWPEWVPVLSRMLRHEADVQMFHVGLRALGRIGNANAVAALTELSRLRPAPEFQQMVADVLAEADPEQAFKHHLSGLLEGSSNPRVANAAASRLEELVNESHLEALKTALQHPDLLVFRHAIQLLARVPSAEAARCLASFLEDYHQEALEDRELKGLLPDFRNLPKGDALEKATALLAQRLEARQSQALQLLQGLDGPEASRTLEALKEEVVGPLETFLARVLAAAQESSTAHLGKLPAEAAEEIHQRARRLAFAMDNGAEGLIQMVRSGFFPSEEALAILEKAIRESTGREGLVRAFALILPAEDETRLDLLLSHPEGSLRAAAVDALGERNEESLRPALLKACHDAISDIAHRALDYVGRLPGGEALARELIQAPSLEEIQLGLSFIGIHRLAGLAPDLLVLVQGGVREEIALKALEALGRIGSPNTAGPLLDLLHSGQSPQLQVALAQTLRDLNLPEAAIALCAKADELKQSEIHALAVEALCRGPQPLDEEAGRMLLAQFQAAWDDKNPWPMRLRLSLALPDAMLTEKEQRQAFAGLIQQALAEKRPPNVWSAEEQGRVMQVAKALANR